MKTFLALALLLLLPGVHAATYTADSTSQADVQAKATLAGPGDTLIIPAGTSTWASPVLVTNPIIIIGAGVLNTRLINSQGIVDGTEQPLFDVNLRVDGRMEISGLRMTNANQSSGIMFGGGAVHDTADIVHHCRMENFRFAIFAISAWGVASSNVFKNDRTLGAAFPVITRTPGHPTTASLIGYPAPPYAWGTSNAFFVEDNEVTYTNSAVDGYLSDTEYPANYVWRHNTIHLHRSNATSVDGHDMHGETGDANVLEKMGMVIYKNDYHITGNTTVNPMKLADVRGGVGSLVYSNRIFGLDGYVAFSINPSGGLLTNCYAWQNKDQGGASDVSYSGLNGLTENVHYALSQPAGFAEYPYPHLLVGGPVGGGDVTAPAITITGPTSSPTFSTVNSSVTVSGTASDAVGVAAVTYGSDQSDSGSATGTTAWSFNASLQPGVNIYTVIASDAAGNNGTDVITITKTLVGASSISGGQNIKRGKKINK